MSAKLSPVYFVVPVWGDSYVKLFTEVCLPAQLSPGNIPSLRNLEQCQYHIYTTQEFYDPIYRSDAFQKLEKVINASIHIVAPPQNHEERYDKKSEIYRAAIRRASQNDAVNFFLNADIVLADGFVRRGMELLAEGKRVIELPGPRTVKEVMARELVNNYRNKNGAIVVSPRRLTSLSMKNLHPLEHMHFWRQVGEDERFHPSHLYWRVGEKSILARCIHLYPIIVHPRDRAGALEFDTTIDDDLVERACPDEADTHVVTDSDEMFCCELSSAEAHVGNMGRRGDIDSVVEFFFRYGKERNARLLEYKIRMVADDEPDADWERAEALSDKVVDELIKRVFEPPLSKRPDADGNYVPKPKLRMLVAVWGGHHSALFVDYALPSLLAPNNIPLLADHFELDFEFLTMAPDISGFKSNAAVMHLAKYATLHFTKIDDLDFRHSYGILLTYAFARGIVARREEMTDTYFVFLNADFVFSDGSLRSMLQALQDGYNAVVVPSFRCISEDFTSRMRGELTRMREGSPILSLSPRSMVRTALDLIHPTFAAKTVNQDGPYTTLVNQFLWQVDKSTMVGRFYLLFMLCVKPEVPLDEVVGFCDYALVPQLVPSGKVKVFTDSDDVFLLELQNRAHEGGKYIVDDRPSMSFLAEQLSEWSTPLHRDYAAHDLVFHAGELPKKLDQVKAQAKSFIDDLDRRLDPPWSYREHQYWTGTLAAMGVDPDGIPLLRRGTSDNEPSSAEKDAEQAEARLNQLRKLRKKKKAGKLLAWAERLENSLAQKREVIANLRRIRNRMSQKIERLRTQVRELEARRPADADLVRRTEEAEAKWRQAEAELSQLMKGLALKFDAEFYLKSNPDVAKSGLDPETHYRTIGWKRGSDPSPYFDVTGYLNGNLDVKAAEMDPWDHFCRYGAQEGRHGWRRAFIENRPPAVLPSPSPSPSEKAEEPAEKARPSSGWMSSVFKRSKKHVSSDRDLVQGSGYFDAGYYLKNNPDVADAKIDPLEHYLSHGGLEGRRPSAVFDGAGYLEKNPDVKAAGINPIVHWLQHGQSEGRPSPVAGSKVKEKA